MTADELRELAQKIKVAKAEGVVLDWLVAKAEGLRPHVFIERDYGQSAVRPLSRWCGVNVSPVGYDVYAPSADWSQGGPIIEQVGITLNWSNCKGLSGEMWDAACEVGKIFSGPTALVAAMRCFVASRLGEEVDVPEELLT